MKVVAGLDYTGMDYFVVVVAAALREHPDAAYPPPAYNYGYT
jgi:hypothetical protein